MVALDTPAIVKTEIKLPPAPTIIIGANGMVGRALMMYLSDAIGTYRNGKDNFVDERTYEYLDISDKAKVEEFFAKHKPRRVFLAAYNPWVDGCENPETDKVNVLGVSHVISNCDIQKSQLIFFSSFYVFDGTSQVPYKTKDDTYPINRYGRQKEQNEREIMNREGLQWLIIRAGAVFGQEGTPKNFVDQIRRAVISNKKIFVPADQTMTPIWSMDLARISIHLSNRYSGAIFHVAGNKCMTKYEFAINVAYKLGCKKPHELIVGVKSEDMKSNNPNAPLAIRPKNGCLDSGMLQARAIQIPSLEKSLKTYLKQTESVLCDTGEKTAA